MRIKISATFGPSGRVEAFNGGAVDSGSSRRFLGSLHREVCIVYRLLTSEMPEGNVLTSVFHKLLYFMC